MEFLKHMKKREYIEMGLKTAIGVLLGIIVIFFMEAMICNIYMDAIKDHPGSYPSTPEDSVFYVVKNDNKTYDIYLNYDPDGVDSWVLHHDDYSQSSYDALWEEGVGELWKADNSKNGAVLNRKPNCFDIYMNGVHYAVMVVFILAIGGVYAWRFTLIAKEYKKLERKFNKTGKVFI